MSKDKCMYIKVTNKGVTDNGYVNMSFEIVGRRPLSPLNEIYFLAVLNGLRDIDEPALLRALDCFIEQELELDDDEE